MNDYQILSMAKEDREIAEEILYKKYATLLYNKALNYCHNNLYFEDYLNEARYILYKTIDTYRDNNCYSTYLNKCLNNGLINFYNHELCVKYKILNESVSINDDVKYNLNENDNVNPENIVINEENYNCLILKIKNSLSWKEELIFDLKRQYYTNKEISMITGNKLRNIYNIVNRIKNKMYKIMSKY